MPFFERKEVLGIRVDTRLNGSWVEVGDSYHGDHTKVMLSEGEDPDDKLIIRVKSDQTVARFYSEEKGPYLIATESDKSREYELPRGSQIEIASGGLRSEGKRKRVIVHHDREKKRIISVKVNEIFSW